MSAWCVNKLLTVCHTDLKGDGVSVLSAALKRPEKLFSECQVCTKDLTFHCHSLNLKCNRRS